MKKSTKLLSVLLAFVMVISVFTVTMASAAAPYKPTYNDEVTEKDVELLLQDVDTVLLAKVLTGSTIESIYKALPGLSMLVGHAKDVEFYSDGIWKRTPTMYRDEQNQLQTRYEFSISKPTTALNQERFADLKDYGDQDFKDQIAAKDADKWPQDMEGRFTKGKIIEDVKDENGTITEEGTFTKFFKDHPIEVNSLEDFKNEINNVVATVVMDGLGLISALGTKYTPAEDYGSFVIPASGGAPQALYNIFEGLDDICAGLGIEQPTKATECFVQWNAAHTSVTWFPTKDAEGNPMDSTDLATKYVQNIVNALFNDGLAKNVVGAIQSLVVPESGAQIYKGVAKIVNALEDAINSPFGAQLGKQDDGSYTGIAATLHNIYTMFQTIPTLEPDTDKERLDIEGLVNFVIAQFVDPNTLSLEFVDRAEGDGKAPKGILGISTESEIMPMAAIVSLKFRHMQLDRVANAESMADVVKIVYDYLYDNLICYRETNTLIKMAIQTGILENALNMQLPEDVKNEILTALETDREPLADHLITLVAEMDEVHHHRDLQAVAGKAATCTEDGTVAYYHCPDCGLDFATDDMYAAKETALTSLVAPATGHQHVTKVEAKAATCTENGNVEYYRCDDCGLAFKTEADAAANTSFDPTIKAAGHQFGEWKEENGKKTRTCSVCGATETADVQQPSQTPANPNNPVVPNTGAVVTGFSAVSLMVAAAFVTMAVRSKKGKERDE